MKIYLRIDLWLLREPSLATYRRSVTLLRQKASRRDGLCAFGKEAHCSGLIGALSTPREVTRLVYARAERGIRHLIDRDIEDSGLPEPALKYLRTLSEMTEAGPNKAPPYRFGCG